MAEEAWKAAARYEGYRTAAREATVDAIVTLGLGDLVGRRFSLTGIGAYELTDWQTWPVKHFEWQEVVDDFRPYLKRFEIAIWQNAKLLGMAIGRPSDGPDNVTLHFLERRWGENPLKGWIAEIATDATDNYARILGKQWVRLKNPIKEAIPKYESLGFQLAKPIGGNTYYRRQVSR